MALPREAIDRWEDDLIAKMLRDIQGLEQGSLGGVPVLGASDPLPVDMEPDSWLIRVSDPPAVLEVIEETATSYISSASNTCTLAVPEGASTDDLLLAAVTHQNNGETITPPANWVSIQELVDSDFRTTELFGYPVTGLPPTVDQVFTTVGSGRMLGGMARITGVDLANIVQVAGAIGTRVNEVYTVPALTGAAGSLVIAAININSASGLPNPQPLVYENSMTSILSLTTGTDDQVSRTSLDLAWALAPSDFAAFDVTAAGAVSAMGAQAVALGAA